MANYQTLKAAIASVIKTNGEEAITGAVMQSTLLGMIESFAAGFQFKGVATPQTVVGAPDQNYCWIGGRGSYSNFGNGLIEVPTGCIVVFTYDGGFQHHIINVADGIADEVFERTQELVNDFTEDFQPVVVEGDVTNAPDEEDLTSIDQGGTDVLKFKNKAYDPLLFSGMGRVYLRKNVVNGHNLLTQEMFYKESGGEQVPNTNTIFIIQYDYELAEDITVPENSVLQFEGGSISGEHTITGSNTDIQAGLVKIFTDSILLNGEWAEGQFCPEWVGSIQEAINICESESNNFSTVRLSAKEYIITSPLTIGKPINIIGVSFPEMDIYSRAAQNPHQSSIIRQTGAGNIINFVDGRIYTSFEISNLFLYGNGNGNGIYSNGNHLLRAKFNNLSIYDVNVGIYLYSSASYMAGYAVSFDNVDIFRCGYGIKVERENNTYVVPFSWFNSNSIRRCLIQAKYCGFYFKNIASLQSNIFDGCEVIGDISYDYNTLIANGFQSVQIENCYNGNTRFTNGYSEVACPKRPNDGNVNEHEVVSGDYITLKPTYIKGNDKFASFLFKNIGENTNLVIDNTLFGNVDAIKIDGPGTIVAKNNMIGLLDPDNDIYIKDLSSSAADAVTIFIEQREDVRSLVVSNNLQSKLKFNLLAVEEVSGYYVNRPYQELYMSANGLSANRGHSAKYPIHDLNDIANRNLGNGFWCGTVVVNIMSDYTNPIPLQNTYKFSNMNIDTLVINGGNHTINISQLIYFLLIEGTSSIRNIYVRRLNINMTGGNGSSAFFFTRNINAIFTSCNFTTTFQYCNIIKDTSKKGCNIVLKNCTHTASYPNNVKTVVSKYGNVSSDGTIISSDIWCPATSGTTSERPSVGYVQGASIDAGFEYFDTTLGKPIYWNGTAWIDATGATV